MSRKPEPLYESPPRKRCPVCGEITYSSAGIHPQCAVHQADSKRMAKVKSAAATAPKTTSTDASKLSPWQTTCPKCKAVVHVRKKVCECGHTLIAGKS